MISTRLKIEGERSKRPGITGTESTFDIPIEIVEAIDHHKEIDADFTMRGAIPRDVVGEWLLSLANDQRHLPPWAARNKRFRPLRG